jgi:hypothetical protein
LNFLTQFLGTAFLFSIFSFISPVYSAQVTLAWDANPDPNIAGYRVYYGTSSRDYSFYADVGNQTTCTIANLQNTMYYFAATAYDAGGQQSPYSAEVVYSPPSCSFSISPASQSFPSSPAVGAVDVSTAAGCNWTVTNNSPSWVFLTSTSSATGPGTVNYSLAANTGTNSRTGTLTIAGQTYTVTQAAAACTYSISPASASILSSGGTGTVSVAAGGGCSWSASSNASWIAITPVSGNGSGPVAYSVDANPGTASRTGTITIAGQTLTVTQSGTPNGSFVFALNCGGSQYTSKTGTVYKSDRYYQGGRVWKTSSGIAETSDDRLYRSERYGNFAYSIPMANGNYLVTVKFAEIYWSSKGKRIFDVYIEGEKVISGLDIFARVGKYHPCDVSIPVTVTDGKLDISFRTVADNAKVSAILVQTR